MTIFVVFDSSDPTALGRAIESKYPNDHLSVGGGQWFISSDELTKSVSDGLGITDGSNGSAIVVSISNYYGRHNTSTWEWIKLKWEGGPHGQ